MAHPQIAVFARLANGNDKRVRAIEGQTTLLGRTMHGIAYDAVHDEIVVPQQFGQAILTFGGAASGEAKPLRVIQGSRTQLRDPDHIDVDGINSEIYVPEGDKVLVFHREANGNAAPIRILTGPDTRIGSAKAVAIDNTHELIIVVSSAPESRTAYQIAIFDRTAAGNTKPKRVITGLPAYGNVAVDPERGFIFVVLPPRVGTPLTPPTENISYVGVWSIDDNGPVPPRYTIGGPKGILIEPRGVTLDLKNKAIIVSDKELNAILTFQAPEIFNQPGSAAPRR